MESEVLLEEGFVKINFLIGFFGQEKWRSRIAITETNDRDLIAQYGARHSLL